MTVRQLIAALMRDANLDDTVHSYEGEKTGIRIDRTVIGRTVIGISPQQVAFYETDK